MSGLVKEWFTVKLRKGYISSPVMNAAKKESEYFSGVQVFFTSDIEDAYQYTKEDALKVYDFLGGTVDKVQLTSAPVTTDD